MNTQLALYDTQLKTLSKALTVHRSLWDLTAFNGVPDTWLTRFPELTDAVFLLADTEVEHYRSQTSDWIQLAQQWLPSLSSVVPLLDHYQRHSSIQPFDTDNPFAAVGIPGRKWKQIGAFVSHLSSTDTANHFVDWCAGKGYLSRLLTTQKASVTALEWNNNLCEAGQTYALQHKLPITFHCCDVLAEGAEKHLNSNSHVTALHACGALHMRMLEHAANADVAGITFSPCCYHLVPEVHYTPMSQLATRYDLQLSKDNLRTAVQQTVTAGNHVRNNRQKELIYRLGLDAFIREHHQKASYTSFPSCKKQLLSEGFEAFFRWACDAKSIALPASINFDHWYQEGVKLVAISERIELVKDLFRGLLELWLVLDRASYLLEKGYDVKLKTFCEQALTPRNYYIQALRTT